MESGRGHLLRQIQACDMVMIYGAGSSETKKAERRKNLGFMQVALGPTRDMDMAFDARGASVKKRQNQICLDPGFRHPLI